MCTIYAITVNKCLEIYLPVRIPFWREWEAGRLGCLKAQRSPRNEAAILSQIWQMNEFCDSNMILTSLPHAGWAAESFIARIQCNHANTSYCLKFGTGPLTPNRDRQAASRLWKGLGRLDSNQSMVLSFDHVKLAIKGKVDQGSSISAFGVHMNWWRFLSLYT